MKRNLTIMIFLCVFYIGNTQGLYQNGLLSETDKKSSEQQSSTNSSEVLTNDGTRDVLRDVIYQIVVDEYYDMIKDIVAEIVHGELGKYGMGNPNKMSNEDYMANSGKPYEEIVSNQNRMKAAYDLVYNYLDVIEKTTGNSLLTQQISNNTIGNSSDWRELQVDRRWVEGEEDANLKVSFVGDKYVNGDYTNSMHMGLTASNSIEPLEVEKPVVENTLERKAETVPNPIETRDQFRSRQVNSSNEIEAEEILAMDVFEEKSSKKEQKSKRLVENEKGIYVIVASYEDLAAADDFKSELLDDYGYEIAVLEKGESSKVGVIAKDFDHALAMISSIRKNISQDAWIMTN